MNLVGNTFCCCIVAVTRGVWSYPIRRPTVCLSVNSSAVSSAYQTRPLTQFTQIRKPAGVIASIPTLSQDGVHNQRSGFVQR